MRHELIKQIRKSKKMTLVDLGKASGYTPSFISQIERGLKEPSLDAMRKIADCLDISIINLLEEQSEITSDSALHRPHCSVIYKEHRQTFKLDDHGALYELVTPQKERDFEKFFMYGLLATIIPGDSSNNEPISHFYEEACYVISGKMKAVVGAEEYMLSEGDSIYIDSYAYHNYVNISDEDLIIIIFQAK